MSWITPVPACGLSVAICRSRRLTNGEFRRVAEQFLHPVPALLHPVQRQAKIRDRVPYLVECLLSRQPHEQLPACSDRLKPAPRQLGGEQVSALVNLDRQ